MVEAVKKLLAGIAAAIFSVVVILCWLCLEASRRAWLIGAAILFPLFFQLSAGVYQDANPIPDSRGILWSLPLPISILACLAGILAHWRGLARAKVALIYFAALAGFMALSFVVTDGGHRKLMYAGQTLLPVLGLVLGMLLGTERATIAKAFMWVLLVLMPVQLIAGWYQGGLILTNYLYAFSVYQHIQFVPVVMSVAFGFVVVHQWEKHKGLMLALTVIAGLYMLASGSFLAIGFYAGFVVLFFGTRVKLAYIVAGLAAAVVLGGLYYGNVKPDADRMANGSAYVQKFADVLQGKLPGNVTIRLKDWQMYGGWVAERPLLGHSEPPAREVRTSAHNWYLDFAYSFGVLGLLPVIALIGFTAWSLRGASAEVWWLAGFVAFLVLVDCSFKVTLRQPYPGIFAYFLWGLLLAVTQKQEPT